MKCKASFAAGVLSLILVGTSGKAAWAGENQETSSQDARGVSHLFHTGQGYVELFGKTFCTADAPATVACDWRGPRAATKLEPTATAGPRKVRIFGKSICFGHTQAGDDCWLQFPAVESKRDRRRASL